MAAADAGRLHATVGGEVGGAERQALHPRGCAADLLDVGDAASRLEDRVHEQRLGEPGLRLELGEQAVDVVDVLGALDLGDHDDVEPVADLADERGEIVEHPRRVEAVDPGPQLGVAEVDLLADLHQPGASGLLRVRGDGVLEIAQQDVDLGRDVGELGRHLVQVRREEVDHPRRRERDLAGTGSGAPAASGLKKSLALRMGRNDTEGLPTNRIRGRASRAAGARARGGPDWRPPGPAPDG